MRLGIISDIHSNLQALRAVFVELREQKVEYILCLGDIVGYGASPNKVVERLKKVKDRSVFIKGDHDEAVVKRKTSRLNKNASKAVDWTVRNIKDENRGFLAEQEKYEALEIDDYRFFMVHGSPEDYLYDYISKNTDSSKLDRFFEKTEANVLLLGHTHMPFTQATDNGLIVNPGSVGQPRDNDRRASYAVLDMESREFEVRRVPYNVEKAAIEIERTKLPNRLGDRLRYGH